MRLIDADEIENEFGISDADIIAKEAIRDAPTIDAVPVVRCRECKHCMKMIGNSYHYCVTHNTKMYAEDFCSYGEQKEDNT